jgi:hypothetical protein
VAVVPQVDGHRIARPEGLRHEVRVRRETDWSVVDRRCSVSGDGVVGGLGALLLRGNLSCW